MKKILTRHPFFIILLPLFIVVQLESEYHQLIDYKLVFDRILILFIVALLSYLLSCVIMRCRKKGALLAFAFCFVFYFLTDIKVLLSRSSLTAGLNRYVIVLPFVTLFFVAFYLFLRKSKSNFSRTYVFLNTLFLIITLHACLKILFKNEPGTYGVVKESGTEKIHPNAAIKPDIYFIISDAYSSSHSLKSEYGFDNDNIESYLKRKGFWIVSDSKSNYSYTAYSVGSIFNMNYLTGVDSATYVSGRDYLRALQLVYKNKVFGILKKEGYAVFNHSLFDIDSHPTTIRPIDFWGFRDLFNQYNLIDKVYKEVGYNFPEWIHQLMTDKYFVNSSRNRARIDSMVYDHLLFSIKMRCDRPKMIYAHFLRTHPPFIFDSTGKNFPNIRHDREGYIHQISYMNRVFKDITDSIFYYSKRPFVIIILGDHGLSLKNDLSKLHPNFNAIYFSDGNKSDSLGFKSSVNTFRVVFNHFFKTQLPLLEDKFYRFGSY